MCVEQKGITIEQSLVVWPSSGECWLDDGQSWGWSVHGGTVNLRDSNLQPKILGRLSERAGYYIVVLIIL